MILCALKGHVNTLQLYWDFSGSNILFWLFIFIVNVMVAHISVAITVTVSVN
jgi:hypothetical protein